MKVIFTAGFLLLFCIAGLAQEKTSKISQPNTSKKILVVETSCGECKFNMEGKGCHLAVRIEGKSYFVDGTSIDDHGDAHSADGFCETIRKAEVQGEIVSNRFKATYFKLKPIKEEKLQQ